MNTGKPQLSFRQKLDRIFDRSRPNRYALRKYLIRDGKVHPFAVICPGGGYHCVCSYIEGKPFAEALNARGISAFVVYYRVKEKARYPMPQDDLAHAVQDILKHAQEWKLDCKNYSVWGSSAGGHLAASFGTERMGYPAYGLPKPAAMVLIYPVITMGAGTHIGTRENLLGGKPSAELISETSVEQQITASYPKTFVWCGLSDHTVSPENSRLLAEKLCENHIPVLLCEYPDVDHGVGLGKGLSCEGWLDGAVRFWLSDQ